jgi:hypothetical protein
MTEATNFYTSCMNHEVHPGVIADTLGEAGYIIGGLGHILEWGGGISMQLGFPVAIAYAAKFGLGRLMEKFSKVSETSETSDTSHKAERAFARLLGMGVGVAIGTGCAFIGKPVTVVGNFLHARETQCQIGQMLPGWIP